MSNNRISELFNIKYPIVQGGMIWASGHKLATAVSNAGGLGLLGAGSMYPDVLRHHIQQTKAGTDKPYGVNVPLLYSDLEELMEIIIAEQVPIVFTSAGNPKTYTQTLKEAGIKVVHVVSSVKFALKAQEAGVDAVVAEGFEAGGHNGREESTTFTLIPQVAKAIELPLMAAGGIATGRGMLAAMALGADGVQVGSRFVATPEASSHINFKNAIVEAGEGATHLTLKELAPVRLLRNKFWQDVQDLYTKSPTTDDLKSLLGRARAKKGMFEGDMNEGELEIGQISGLIDSIVPAAQVVADMVSEYEQARQALLNMTIDV
ncbi:NAD(P)H-dependent flavin oxidoreductase [Nonlabens xiamenensis]|uniref:NAD(P)H-dependent flavin oxidoreductase n=1 Tax=Nonlabens xiamenensis TaxID=2341043 RepID=UPI000F60957E|nr:nitronate monooxygenase [Nonlabens xiamenensis]